jgi:methionyl-tRNA formyltransferase
MKVVFLAPEERAYLPLFFERVVRALGDQVAAIAVVSPIYKGDGWLSQGLKFTRAFGLPVFLLEGLDFVRCHLLDALSRFIRLGRFYSVKRVARFHAIPLYEPRDINAPPFLQTMEALHPDLIVSVSCPQVFGDELIDIPSIGCLNVHSALLPQYRGVLPTFWALAEGEKRTGVTVHYISKGVDEGDIVLQREIEIAPDDTLHTLIGRAKRVGADLLLETIDQFDRGVASRKPNPSDEGSYFSFPTREDVKRFRERGRRVR